MLGEKWKEISADLSDGPKGKFKCCQAPQTAEAKKWHFEKRTIEIGKRVLLTLKLDKNRFCEWSTCWSSVGSLRENPNKCSKLDSSLPHISRYRSIAFTITGPLWHSALSATNTLNGYVRKKLEKVSVCCIRFVLSAVWRWFSTQSNMNHFDLLMQVDFLTAKQFLFLAK